MKNNSTYLFKFQIYKSYLLTLRKYLINQFGLGIVTNHMSIGWEDIGHGKDNPLAQKEKLALLVKL